MKPRLTPTVSIFVCAMLACMAFGVPVASLAQNPSIIQNTRNVMNGVAANSAAASNAALGGNPPVQVPRVVSPAPAAAADAGVEAAISPRQGRHGGKRASGIGGKRSAGPKANVANAKREAAVPLGPHAGSGAGENLETEQEVVPDSKYSANGRRDPFTSPVVGHQGGSGCSTGKKCLEIGAINLRGVVHAESGFIAVVSNTLNKAYFLRENDPVFNGYVVKITGDSIVFQETLQDRLGKSFTREVVKKITTPAV